MQSINYPNTLLQKNKHNNFWCCNFTLTVQYSNCTVAYNTSCKWLGHIYWYHTTQCYRYIQRKSWTFVSLFTFSASVICYGWFVMADLYQMSSHAIINPIKYKQHENASIVHLWFIAQKKPNYKPNRWDKVFQTILEYVLRSLIIDLGETIIIWTLSFSGLLHISHVSFA